MKLDEFSKRKPNFEERNSTAVALADGQTWWIPKPWLEIRPVFQDGKAVNNYPVFTYGRELDDLIEAISSAEGVCDQLVGVATLAAYLLRWHYYLEDLELDRLLAFRRADVDSQAWVNAILRIATGRNGPKVGSAGGD